MRVTEAVLEKYDKPDLIRLVLAMQDQYQEQNQIQQKQIEVQKGLIESLQKQNYELRTEVHSLKKIVEEQRQEISGLKSRINQLEKTSNTSSKPPSSDQNRPYKNQSLRKKSGKKPGGQPGHKGFGRFHIETPDQVIVCAPNTRCGKCGLELDMSSGKVTEKRQEIEMPSIKPVVTEYQKLQVKCACGTKHVGTFPVEISSNIQMGPAMRGLLIYFNVVQLIPYQRLSDVCSDIFGFSVSKGSIENFLEIASQKSMALRNQIMQILKNSPWVGSDETTKKVGIKKWWEWVWQNTQASYYAVEDSRGYKVVQKHFGENYQGILVHDCYSAHNNTAAKSGHQLCHPHIQRDLQFLIEKYRCKWAYDLSQFLSASQRARDQIWGSDFDAYRRQKIIKQYQRRFSKFLRRSSRQKDILKLQKRMIKHRAAILHFMSFPAVPFHNNGSEQAIRMAKVKQKISGCFRSQRGAERHSILLSIIETAKKQNMNPLAAK